MTNIHSYIYFQCNYTIYSLSFSNVFSPECIYLGHVSNILSSMIHHKIDLSSLFLFSHASMYGELCCYCPSCYFSKEPNTLAPHLPLGCALPALDSLRETTLPSVPILLPLLPDQLAFSS